MSNIPFSANSILILKLNEFKYLPLGPLNNCHLSSLKDILVSMANSVTNASRVRVVQKSTARDISLFTLFSILILVGVQSGNWRSWKFVLPLLTWITTSATLCGYYQRKFHKHQKKCTFVKIHLNYDADLCSLVQQITNKSLQSNHRFLSLRVSKT